jgi:hypothetical protein
MARTVSNVIAKVSADTTNFEQGMKRASKQSQQFGDTSKKVNQQMRFMRGGLGQVGHQVQDIAVQLQMGQNAMLVFGQQGSQIASLFGPGGAMIGAVLAVGAALSMALLPRIFGATEAMKALKEESKTLADRFDELSTAEQKYAKLLTDRQIAKIDEELKILDETDRKRLRTTNANAKAVKRFLETEEEHAERIIILDGNIAILNKKKEELQKKTDGVTTAFKKQEASLEKQIDTFGKSAHALREYAIQSDLAAKKITDDEAKILIAKSRTLESLEQNAERQKELEAERKKAQKDIAKEADKAFKDQERTAQRFADTIGKGFTQAITGAMSFKDAMKNVAASVINDLTAMIVKKMITDQIFGALMDTSFFGGGSSGGDGLVPKSQPSSTVNSKIGRHAYEGGGFTGFGARSGGVDGRGGFPAILHPNETVIDHTKGQGMGAVVNQTINVTTGVQQTVRAEIQNLMPQIQEAAKAAVADSRARGGSYSKALVGR